MPSSLKKTKGLDSKWEGGRTQLSLHSATEGSVPSWQAGRNHPMGTQILHVWFWTWKSPKQRIYRNSKAKHHTDNILQLRLWTGHMSCSTTAPKPIYIFTVCLFSFPFSLPHPGLPCEFLDINTGIGSNSSSVTFSEPSGASKPDIRLVSSAA